MKTKEAKRLIVSTASFLEDNPKYVGLVLEVLNGDGGYESPSHLVFGIKSHILSWTVNKMWWVIVIIACAINVLLVYRDQSIKVEITVIIWASIIGGWLMTHKSFSYNAKQPDFFRLAKLLKLIIKMKLRGFHYFSKSELITFIKNELKGLAWTITQHPADEVVCEASRISMKEIITLGIDCGLLITSKASEAKIREFADDCYAQAFKFD